MPQPAIDYYGYEPTLQLERAVVITGHAGADIREVTYDLAALTGLRVHDLDHRIAHDAGVSAWHLSRQDGVAAYLARARALAPALLRETPFGLISVGAGTLESGDALFDAVRTTADLLFLRLSPTESYWRLRQLQRQDRLHHPLVPLPLTGPGDLASLHQAAQRTQTAARACLDVRPGEIHQTVLSLQRLLAQHHTKGRIP